MKSNYTPSSFRNDSFDREVENMFTNNQKIELDNIDDASNLLNDRKKRLINKKKIDKHKTIKRKLADRNKRINRK